MLKLFTNTDLLTQENRKYVFPLLLDLYYVTSDVLIRYYKIVDDVNESDIAVLPLEYGYSTKKYKTAVLNFFNKSKKAQKSIWVYSGGDFGYSLKDQKIYNFRLSGFKSKLNNRTFLMPSFIDDPYVIHFKKEFFALEKKTKPEIGFVGQAKGGKIKYLKELLSYVNTNIRRVINNEYRDYQAFYPSTTKRAKYLDVLKRSNQLKANFTYRNSYRAGFKNVIEKQKTTQDFYQNIYENPYTFCLRGSGNFSVRFYETLAVGRIPILINTDCLLPLNNKISWYKHCVIIDEADVNLIISKVIDFHDNLSDDEFVKLQKSNRDLWNNYLRRHTFFKEVHDYFKRKINE